MQHKIPMTTFAGGIAKRARRVLALLFLTICISSMAAAQSATDEAKVLQKSLDLPELQSYFLKNGDNSYQPVYIMQYPVSFSETATAKKFGSPVIFLTRDKINDDIKSYFLFEQFVVKGDDASVKMTFYYHTNSDLKHVTIVAEMNKADGQWTVASSDIIK